MGERTRGVLLLLAAGALWGLNGLYVRILGAAGLSPVAVVFVRYVCALAVLAPVAMRHRLHVRGRTLRMLPRHLACCVAMGVVPNALGGVLCAYAVEHVGAATTSVLLYTAPVFGCLLSRMMYGERIGRRKACAIACNFVGVVLVVAGGGGLGSQGIAAGGLLAGLGYGLTFSLLAILSRPVSLDCDPVSIVLVSDLATAVVLAVPAVLSGTLSCALAPQALAAALLYGGLSSVLANLIYQRGLGCGVPTSSVPVITSDEVAVSALVGATALHESLAPAKMAGVGAVLASIVVMNAGAAPGEVHGVRIPSAVGALGHAFAVGSDLHAPVADVALRRDVAVVSGWTDGFHR